MNATTTYSLESLRTTCPAMFATDAENGVSDYYQFVPTLPIVEKMLERGWEITAAHNQMRANGKLMTRGFHMLRFRHPEVPELPRGEGRVETVLINSHNRSRRLSLRAGIFRLICSNGMIVPAGMTAGTTLTHLDTIMRGQEVVAAADAIAISTPRVAGMIKEMSEREMSAAEQLDFACRVLKVRYGTYPPTISAPSVLAHRRPIDQGNSLWLTMNRCQENLMRGCQDGRHLSKPIVSLSEQVRVNEAIFDVAREFLKSAKN